MFSKIKFFWKTWSNIPIKPTQGWIIVFFLKTWSNITVPLSKDLMASILFLEIPSSQCITILAWWGFASSCCQTVFLNLVIQQQCVVYCQQVEYCCRTSLFTFFQTVVFLQIGCEIWPWFILSFSIITFNSKSWINGKHILVLMRMHRKLRNPDDLIEFWWTPYIWASIKSLKPN